MTAHGQTSAAIIDLLPTDIFESRAPAQLSDYVREQAAMHRALAFYLDEKYEVIAYRLHLSGSFGRVIKSCLYDFFVDELHAKKISSRWPDGLSSVTIWKSRRQYIAIVVSEMIPGDKAIYGYFALRKR
ncbi:hypothetical protein [Luteibacter rhizovicinus]|uniref:hypothetical protein n=1 Tax=Luteibacter rhizovicinus TaxID=242606 RepID=UPI000F790069|nr:hypothetical protein [Luteibacter rhizovicinus]